MKAYSISEPALLKVLLHAAKHPTSGVNGVLLGTASSGAGGATAAGPAASTSEGGGSAAVDITDALPVCHSFITLTPVLEAALSQVEQHVKEQQKQQKGLRIVGYYQCNERLTDGELGAGRRIADRIEAAFPDSVAVVLDSVALDAALKEQQQEGRQRERAALQLYAKDGARGWVKVPAAGSGGDGGKGGFSCPSQGIAARLAQYAGEGRHQQLCDFEEHLDDIALDWLNPGLLQGPA